MSDKIKRTYKNSHGRTVAEYVHVEHKSRPLSPLRFVRKVPDPAEVSVEVEMWESTDYDVWVRRFDHGFPIAGVPYAIVSVTHATQRAIHDWRDLQRIKNAVCGEEWEGLELYPSESRLIDPSNRFYLWCVPPGVVRWGLPQRVRFVLTSDTATAPQRPFDFES